MAFDCDEAWESFCSNSADSEVTSIIERGKKVDIPTNIPKCSDIYLSLIHI